MLRVPAAVGEYRRVELRSPDPTANPYLAFTLMIYAALDGITQKMSLEKPSDLNLFTADENELAQYKKLPGTFKEACQIAALDDFIKAHIPSEILKIYCGK